MTANPRPASPAVNVQAEAAPFRRDRFTWLAYALLAYFAYLQAAPGLVMPFIRADMGLSYTIGGLHVSAFALGMIVAGLTGAALAARLGRRALFWGGTGGMAGAALLLAVGRQPAVTIAATFLMGYLGALLLIMIQAALADRHGIHRATALTESNIFAMLCAGVAPLMLGFFAATVFGWRGALLVPIVGAALLAVGNWRVAIPERQSTGQVKGSGRLPGLFWAYWLVLLSCVAMEWAMVGWGTEFLHAQTGLAPAAAAAFFGVFFFGGVLGRFANSRWTLHLPAQTLLLLMLIVVAIGFPIFWLGQNLWLTVAGLAIVGFGVGSLFPLGLGTALNVAAAQSDAASSFVSMGTGMAMLLAPFTLGWLADAYDLRTAFGAVIVILAAAIVITVVTNRIATARPAG